MVLSQVRRPQEFIALEGDCCRNHRGCKVVVLCTEKSKHAFTSVYLFYAIKCVFVFILIRKGLHSGPHGVEGNIKQYGNELGDRGGYQREKNRFVLKTCVFEFVHAYLVEVLV